MNPHQWSLAKHSSLKYEKWCQKLRKQGKTNYSIYFNEFSTHGKYDALKTLQINRSRP